MKKSERQIKKIIPIQIGIGIILIVLLVLLFFWLKGDFIGYKPKVETVQYSYGKRIENSAGVEFINEDGIVRTKDGKSENTLLNQPILYENEFDDEGNIVVKSDNELEQYKNPARKSKLDTLTITSDMMYTNPEFNEPCYRLKYFTSLHYSNGLVAISEDNKSKTVSGGYLYDGDDLYIFLEETTLCIGEKEIVLGPLSYARVHYRHMMEYYNSTDGSYEFIAQQDLDVLAKVRDKYVLDLGMDIIEKNGETSLIYTGVEYLEVMPLK